MKKLILSILSVAIFSSGCGVDQQPSSNLNGVKDHFGRGIMGVQEITTEDGKKVFYRMLVCKKLPTGERLTSEMKRDPNTCQNPFLTKDDNELLFHDLPAASEGGAIKWGRTEAEIVMASVATGAAIGGTAGTVFPVAGNIILGAFGAFVGVPVGIVLSSISKFAEILTGRDKKVAKGHWDNIFAPISNKHVDGKVDIKVAVEVVAKELRLQKMDVKVNQNALALIK